MKFKKFIAVFLLLTIGLNGSFSKIYGVFDKNGNWIISDASIRKMDNDRHYNPEQECQKAWKILSTDDGNLKLDKKLYYLSILYKYDHPKFKEAIKKYVKIFEVENETLFNTKSFTTLIYRVLARAAYRNSISSEQLDNFDQIIINYLNGFFTYMSKKNLNWFNEHAQIYHLARSCCLISCANYNKKWRIYPQKQVNTILNTLLPHFQRDNFFRQTITRLLELFDKHNDFLKMLKDLQPIAMPNPSDTPYADILFSIDTIATRNGVFNTNELGKAFMDNSLPLERRLDSFFKGLYKGMFIIDKRLSSLPDKPSDNSNINELSLLKRRFDLTYKPFLNSILENYKKYSKEEQDLIDKHFKIVFLRSIDFEGHQYYNRNVAIQYMASDACNLENAKYLFYEIMKNTIINGTHLDHETKAEYFAKNIITYYNRKDVNQNEKNNIIDSMFKSKYLAQTQYHQKIINIIKKGKNGDTILQAYFEKINGPIDINNKIDTDNKFEDTYSEFEDTDNEIEDADNEFEDADNEIEDADNKIEDIDNKIKSFTKTAQGKEYLKNYYYDHHDIMKKYIENLLYQAPDMLSDPYFLIQCITDYPSIKNPDSSCLNILLAELIKSKTLNNICTPFLIYCVENYRILASKNINGLKAILTKNKSLTDGIAKKVSPGNLFFTSCTDNPSLFQNTDDMDDDTDNLIKRAKSYFTNEPEDNIQLLSKLMENNKILNNVENVKTCQRFLIYCAKTYYSKLDSKIINNLLDVLIKNNMLKDIAKIKESKDILIHCTENYSQLSLENIIYLLDALTKNNLLDDIAKTKNGKEFLKHCAENYSQLSPENIKDLLKALTKNNLLDDIAEIEEGRKFLIDHFENPNIPLYCRLAAMGTLALQKDKLNDSVKIRLLLRTTELNDMQKTLIFDELGGEDLIFDLYNKYDNLSEQDKNNFKNAVENFLNDSFFISDVNKSKARFLERLDPKRESDDGSPSYDLMIEAINKFGGFEKAAKTEEGRMLLRVCSEHFNNILGYRNMAMYALVKEKDKLSNSAKINLLSRIIRSENSNIQNSYLFKTLGGIDLLFDLYNKYDNLSKQDKDNFIKAISLKPIQDLKNLRCKEILIHCAENYSQLSPECGKYLALMLINDNNMLEDLVKTENGRKFLKYFIIESDFYKKLTPIQRKNLESLLEKNNMLDDLAKTEKGKEFLKYCDEANKKEKCDELRRLEELQKQEMRNKEINAKNMINQINAKNMINLFIEKWNKNYIQLSKEKYLNQVQLRGRLIEWWHRNYSQLSPECVKYLALMLINDNNMLEDLVKTENGREFLKCFFTDIDSYNELRQTPEIRNNLLDSLIKNNILNKENLQEYMIFLLDCIGRYPKLTPEIRNNLLDSLIKNNTLNEENAQKCLPLLAITINNNYSELTPEIRNNLLELIKNNILNNKENVKQYTPLLISFIHKYPELTPPLEKTDLIKVFADENILTNCIVQTEGGRKFLIDCAEDPCVPLGYQNIAMSALIYSKDKLDDSTKINFILKAINQQGLFKQILFKGFGGVDLLFNLYNNYDNLSESDKGNLKYIIKEILNNNNLIFVLKNLDQVKQDKLREINNDLTLKATSKKSD